MVTKIKSREWIIVALAALVVLLDQLTKAAVMQYLTPGVPWNPISFLEPIVALNYVTNTGVVFGLFPQMGRVAAFITPTIVILLVVLYRRFAVRHWLLPVCLGMQLGGAFGNLVDRLRFGHVVDFIDFKIWPVFNLADSCIVIGGILLAFLLLREQPRQEDCSAAQAPADVTEP